MGLQVVYKVDWKNVLLFGSSRSTCVKHAGAQMGSQRGYIKDFLHAGCGAAAVHMWQ